MMLSSSSSLCDFVTRTGFSLISLPMLSVGLFVFPKLSYTNDKIRTELNIIEKECVTNSQHAQQPDFRNHVLTEKLILIFKEAYVTWL